MNDSPAAHDTRGAFEQRPMRGLATLPPESFIGARIRAAREHYTLSIEALSRLTKAYDYPDGRGVSASALLRYQAGDALPAAREIRMLCDALGLSADWLIFGRTSDRNYSEAEERFVVAQRQLFADLQARQANGESLQAGGVVEDHAARQQRIESARRGATDDPQPPESAEIG